MKTSLRTLRARGIPIAAVALFVCVLAYAQATWVPPAPVHLVVPYPAGGGTDIAARLVANGVGSALGQPFVVENRAGANGIIAADHVWGAQPDGLTLLFGSADVISINPHTYSTMRFEAAAFRPVAPIAKIGVVLAGRQGIDAQTLPELIARAKTKSYSYAHWGAGSNGRIGIEILQSQAKIQPLLGVPFQGTAPALGSLLSGHVDLMLVPTPLVIANRSKLVIYGVASKQRYPGLKDVPTLAEQGYEVDADIWFGVLAPPKTPQPAIDAVQAQLTKVVRDPATQARMIDLGLMPDLSEPARFGEFILSENGRWGSVIRAANIKIE
jgi:tripartite-type tricarboxylate transporter receptor subunit TctC